MPVRGQNPAILDHVAIDPVGAGVEGGLLVLPSRVRGAHQLSPEPVCLLRLGAEVSDLPVDVVRPGDVGDDLEPQIPLFGRGCDAARASS
jgi:hypothetical protein